MIKHVLLILVFVVITAILYMKAYFLLSFSFLLVGLYLAYIFDTKFFTISDSFVKSLAAVILVSSIVLFVPVLFPFYTDILKGVFAFVIVSLLKNIETKT